MGTAHVGLSRHLPRSRVPWAAFQAKAKDDVKEAATRYVGPSGALFALNCKLWRETIRGPLFPRSFFLYVEDVALWIRLRLAGSKVRFCPWALPRICGARPSGSEAHRSSFLSNVTGPGSFVRCEGRHVQRFYGARRRCDTELICGRIAAGAPKRPVSRKRFFESSGQVFTRTCRS